MIRHNIEEQIFENIFKTHSIEIEVYLRSSKIKGDNYDKFRDVGYEKSIQNPHFIKALTKQLSSNSLILRELGLIETGALAIVVSDDDAEFLKLSEKIIINKVEYTPRNKALGTRFSIEKLPFNYKKIILFVINK